MLTHVDSLQHLNAENIENIFYIDRIVVIFAILESFLIMGYYWFLGRNMKDLAR